MSFISIKYAFLLPVLALIIVFIVSCSPENVTGNATADVPTLTVRVVDENNQIIPGVEIYLNRGYKGKTSQYGNSKGTKQLVLSAGENELEVKAPGYGKFSPILVRGNNSQEVTVILERKKSNIVVTIQSINEDLAGAEVSLVKSGRTTAEQVALADETGTALFRLVADGKYTIVAEKAGYRSAAVKQDVLRSRDGEFVRRTINLIPYPTLRLKVVGGDNLENVQVALYTKKGYNRPDALPEDTKLTDSQGEVVFNDVEYDQPYVLVLKRNGYVAQIVDHSVHLGDRPLKVEMSLDRE